jgi:hypothetical protein
LTRYGIHVKHHSLAILSLSVTGTAITLRIDAIVHGVQRGLLCSTRRRRVQTGIEGYDYSKMYMTWIRGRKRESTKMVSRNPPNSSSSALPSYSTIHFQPIDSVLDHSCLHAQLSYASTVLTSFGAFFLKSLFFNLSARPVGCLGASSTAAATLPAPPRPT